jgi:hypothetical protein
MNKPTACALALVAGSFTMTNAFAQISPGCSPNPYAIQFADVNGDGKADAIVVNSNGITVRESNGTQFVNPTSWTTDAYYGNDFPHTVHFADVTGDGKADAIVVDYASNNYGYVYVRASNGSGFVEPPQQWGVTNTTASNIYGIYFADVTGDGKADLIEVAKNAIWVEPSTGASFFIPAELWSNIGYIGNIPIGYYDPSYNTAQDVASNPVDYIAFADVNGDGKADAIVVNKGGGVTVRLSTGSGFGPNQLWTTDDGAGCHISFADVNGDGRADAIYSCGTGTYVRLSVSTPAPGFSATQTWLNSSPYFGNVGTYFADVLGNKMADAIAVNISGIDVRNSWGSYFSPTTIPSWAPTYFGNVSPFCPITIG